MKNKSLIILLGITTLSLIPKNINENYISKTKSFKQIEEIKDEKKINLTQEEIREYNQKLKEIKDEINLLDKKLGFYLERINNEEYPSRIKEEYLKKLKETEKEIIFYKKQRDSINKWIN